MKRFCIGVALLAVLVSLPTIGAQQAQGPR